MTTRSESAAEVLGSKIKSKNATIGIIGMGYVGLPLALAFGRSEFSVLGFDIDPSKAEVLHRGESYFKHISDDAVKEVVDAGKLEVTSDFSRLPEADTILICVPTPLTVQREPDMKYVVSSTQEVAKYMRAGHLVVLESTTYPGTTDELMREILDRSGLTLGQDYFLGYSPEREDPGNIDFSTSTIPKVVSGVDPVSGEICELLYRQIIDNVVCVSSARAAEATKLTENIFRAVNIALVNELKIVYDKMGIDVWEVIDAAATKPFGYMRFNPGPGWGGHCIPIDPFYLIWKAREYKVSSRFIELAGEVNIRVPEFVIEKLTEALNSAGKSVKDSQILILGLAYKKDIDDSRESPAFEIIDLLLDRGAKISYHDPYIPVAPKVRRWPDLPAMESVALDGAALSSIDAVVIATDHSAVDYEKVLEHAPLIVDTRGVFRTPHEKVVKA